MTYEWGYGKKSPIWWDKSESFLYSMLNGALRILDVDILVTMSFFIIALHRKIAQLHSTQLPTAHILTTYRGWGSSITIDFENLLGSKGGLLSFTSFLSTSRNRSVALTLVDRNSVSDGKIGLLFENGNDASISSVHFAPVSEQTMYAGHLSDRRDQAPRWEQRVALLGATDCFEWRWSAASYIY